MGLFTVQGYMKKVSHSKWRLKPLPFRGERRGEEVVEKRGSEGEEEEGEEVTYVQCGDLQNTQTQHSEQK
jgi:chorismate mutase